MSVQSSQNGEQDVHRDVPSFLPSSETTAPPGDWCLSSLRHEDAETAIFSVSRPSHSNLHAAGSPPATTLSSSTSPLSFGRGFCHLSHSFPCCLMPFQFEPQFSPSVSSFYSNCSWPMRFWTTVDSEGHGTSVSFVPQVLSPHPFGHVCSCVGPTLQITWEYTGEVSWIDPASSAEPHTCNCALSGPEEPPAWITDPQNCELKIRLWF